MSLNFVRHPGFKPTTIRSVRQVPCPLDQPAPYVILRIILVIYSWPLKCYQIRAWSSYACHSSSFVSGGICCLLYLWRTFWLQIYILCPLNNMLPICRVCGFYDWQKDRSLEPIWVDMHRQLLFIHWNICIKDGNQWLSQFGWTKVNWTPKVIC